MNFNIKGLVLLAAMTAMVLLWERLTRKPRVKPDLLAQYMRDLNEE